MSGTTKIAVEIPFKQTTMAATATSGKASSSASKPLGTTLNFDFTDCLEKNAHTSTKVASGRVSKAKKKKQPSPFAPGHIAFGWGRTKTAADVKAEKEYYAERRATSDAFKKAKKDENRN